MKMKLFGNKRENGIAIFSHKNCCILRQNSISKTLLRNIKSRIFLVDKWPVFRAYFVIYKKEKH
jgi:hypothetical protein